jgi:hypothetical protein
LAQQFDTADWTDLVKAEWDYNDLVNPLALNSFELLEAQTQQIWHAPTIQQMPVSIVWFGFGAKRYAIVTDAKICFNPSMFNSKQPAAKLRPKCTKT